MRRVPFPYTDEMHLWIKENYKNVYTKDLTKMFNDKFNTDLSVSCMASYKKRHKYISGIDGTYKKGCVSHNKGLKQTAYMSTESIERTKPTRFKKGNKPVNYRPVGSTRINVDGYKEIKVSDPNKWELYSRYTWRINYGEIPKGMVIYHIDGDKLNDDISNLTILKRSEAVRLNQRGLFSDNVEFNKVAINIAKLEAKIGERKK